MSELSSKYNPAEVEARHYETWERAGYFHADPARGGAPYTIVIPPPNVTGALHLGHAMNGTLQDILIRWRRMRGDNALWMPGTDHAGIATQHVVERKLRSEGVEPRDLGRDRFIDRVWEWKEQYGSRIIGQFKGLGCSCDWERERFTMDEGLSRAVLLVFKKLYEEGLIYRGDYLVNWSPKLQTALSDDEVEHREVDGNLWHFRYPYADGSGHAVVATTRPETMLGDTAVAVNPEDERYRDRIGRMVRLPLMNREIPIIADAFVEKEFGTGMVKVTPAHDPNDYEMGKRHDLPFINLLHPDGRLNQNAGEYAGLTVAEARKRVVADMEKLGLLEKVEPHRHAVGHCYRSGCVVEPYISKQWFVKMRPLAEPALEAVKDGRMEFVPRNWENTYFRWMENVRDWCISRQLWWGHRIPIYTCEDCGEVVCSLDALERCPKCDSGRMVQDPDVLDTWFSSALWPFSTLGWPDETESLKFYYPTSVLVTAHDIIFFWVARMIMMGLKFMGRVPFHKAYITPLIMDESGQKMSKSKGTAIDPMELIKEYGADTVRLTLGAYAAQGRQINLSMKRFEGWRNFTNKIWNAARFSLMNCAEQSGPPLAADALARPLTERPLELEDRWILSELRQATDRATAALENFEFDAYVQTLYDFTWKQYCDWYLELIKPRLYAKGGDEATKASRDAARVTLLTTLERLLRLWHPAAPFITEEIWGRIREGWGDCGAGNCGAGLRPAPSANSGAGVSPASSLAAPSIMVAPWPTAAGLPEPDASAQERVAIMQEIVYLIRNIRGEMGVAPGAPTDAHIVSANAARLETLRGMERFMRALVNLGELSFGDKAAAEGLVSTAVFEDITVLVPLPAELRDQERKRLTKEIARLEGAMKGLRAKLENADFISRAPAEVVGKERQKLQVQDEELAALKAKFEALG